MDVKDQTVCGTVGILNLEKSWAALGRERSGRGPVISGQEDKLLLCGSPDGSDDGLDSVCPLVDIWNVVGLVCSVNTGGSLDCTGSGSLRTSFMIPKTIFS